MSDVKYRIANEDEVTKKPNKDGLFKCTDGELRPREEVVLYDGKAYWIKHEKIGFDIYRSIYSPKSHLEKIVSRITSTENSEVGIELDAYTSNSEILPILFTGSIYMRASNIQFLLDAGFVESMKSGYFFLPKHLEHDKQQSYRKFSNIKHEGNTEVEDYAKFGISSPTFLITEGKRYSCGIELETSSGIIPGHIERNFNMKCVRDGSVQSKQK